jgi:hypothetical protein
MNPSPKMKTMRFQKNIQKKKVKKYPKKIFKKYSRIIEMKNSGMLPFDRSSWASS